MIESMLNNTAAFYTIAETISTTGEIVKAETLVGTYKVRISPLSQREIYYSNHNNLETTHRLYCNYSTTFDAGDRVKYGSNTYEIVGVTNPSEWNRFLQVDLKYVS